MSISGAPFRTIAVANECLAQLKLTLSVTPIMRAIFLILIFNVLNKTKMFPG